MKQKIPYILLGLSIIGILLLIFWPRTDLNSKIQNENIILKEHIKIKDSIIEHYRNEIDNLDLQLDSVNTIIYKDRIVYKDRIKLVKEYIPYQIDSFFKQRYE